MPRRQRRVPLATVAIASMMLSAIPARGLGQQTRKPTSSEVMLSRAITLYATDNATTEAESLFNQVLKARPRVQLDDETARYYLGRYYQRNYYMLRQRNGLSRAVDLFSDIHVAAEGDGRPRRWYAEARFYKGLSCLELARWKDAIAAVAGMRPALDNLVEIDYLVWSAPKRQLNARMPSADVKGIYQDVMNRFAVSSKREGQPDARAVSGIIGALQSSLDRAKLKRSLP